MSNLAWLFNVHDSNHDGYLTKDEVLQVSESLLVSLAATQSMSRRSSLFPQFIFRNEPGDRYLGSVSNLIQNLFEYAESTKPEENPPLSPSLGRSPDPNTGRPRANSIVSDNPHRPYLALATFRMCILADPLLEDFFESDLTNSWRLEILIAEEKPKAPGAGGAVGGWWGGLVNAVMTDENKVRSCACAVGEPVLIRYLASQERINRLADEVGKRLDIQTIEHRPSIGKLDAAAAAIEPTARDSLFSTANQRPPKLPSSPDPNPLSAASMRMPAYPTVSNPWADAPSTSSAPSARHEIDVQAAASQALQREQFVIDDVAEGGEGAEEEDYAGGEGDAELMNQVERMLIEEEAVSGKAASAAQGEFQAPVSDRRRALTPHTSCCRSPQAGWSELAVVVSFPPFMLSQVVHCPSPRWPLIAPSFPDSGGSGTGLPNYLHSSASGVHSAPLPGAIEPRDLGYRGRGAQNAA